MTQSQKLEAYDAAAEAEPREWSKKPGFADDTLIVEYLARELSSSDRERVEERLRADAEFRARAEPLIMIWNLTAPREREPSLADRIEAERSWQRIRPRRSAPAPLGRAGV